MEGNKYKKLLTIVAVTLLGVFIFLAIKYAYVNKKIAQTVSSNYSWEIVQQANMAYVYLRGDGLENVSAAEIKLNFNSNNVKLVSVKPNGFFTNPLMIKWDELSGEFSLIENPETNTESYPTFPLLIVETEVLNSSKLSIDPTSLIYVRDTGGFTPRSHEIQLVK